MKILGALYLVYLGVRMWRAPAFLDDASLDSEPVSNRTMVLDAFTKGDTKNLRPLLSNDVYEDFSGAIKSRADNNETLENSLVGISEAEIIEAELQDKTAFITVKFVSEQINVTRNAEGEVVDGDPGEVTKVTDIWTFARNTRSRDPNWTVVATGTSILRLRQAGQPDVFRTIIS